MQLELEVAPGRATAVARQASRALGAYFTPPDAAHAMAAWALRRGDEVVVEPAFGEGVFLRAIADLAETRSWLGLRVHGSEIDPATFKSATSAHPNLFARTHRADFLALDPFPADVVIGNPPYVRLRHVVPDQASRALAISQQILGQPIDPAGSIWMPFVLQSLRFLRPGGRLAFVLPYEATYVRYARPLWPLLGRSFGSLRVVRVKERLFPSILQSVVLLFADECSQQTSNVQFDVYETVADFLANRLLTNATISLTSIAAGERPFVDALLPADLRLLLPSLRGNTTCASDHLTFHIGYVAGDKRYFHPDAEAASAFALPDASLVRTLTSARRISGKGLLTTELPPHAVSTLFLPDHAQGLSTGEREYVAHGETTGISERYKCRVRRPWYKVPDVKVPDVLLPTFSERPLLLVNDGRFVASNSFLCGYIHSGASPLAIAAAWYTSLTLLECELQVHALGGGVMVFVPREAGRIRITSPVDPDLEQLVKTSEAIRRGNVDGAFRAGDEAVLTARLKIGHDAVGIIRAGIDRLRDWRTSNCGR